MNDHSFISLFLCVKHTTKNRFLILSSCNTSNIFDINALIFMKLLCQYQFNLCLPFIAKLQILKLATIKRETLIFWEYPKSKNNETMF